MSRKISVSAIRCRMMNTELVLGWDAMSSLMSTYRSVVDKNGKGLSFYVG